MRESLRKLAGEDGREGERRASRRVRIELLDDDHITIDVDRKARGGDLLDLVSSHLDIVEKDYFGFLHTQRGNPRVWVDLGRRLSKTFKNEPWDVRLAVKFYPPEPAELCDDVSRYQLCLAVRRDLMEGRLTCSTITYALLASYVAQAERGDREARLPAPALAQLRAAPLRVLTPDLEEQVDDLYIKHRGQTPAKAELNYLENAKKLPLYGAELHAARDSLEVDILLAVSSGGIAVYRDGMLMNRFSWAMITRISYNKRTFTLRLRAAECQQYEAHVTFRLAATRAAKNLWRCSVEHHMFFRRAEPVAVERVCGFPRLGSRRVSCRRTLQQLRAHSPRPAPRAELVA